MDAKELRIGNWVKHKNVWCYRDMGGEFEFQWEERDWYAMGECTMSVDNLEPIPLTEEWLLKLGLEKFPKFMDCLKGGYNIRIGDSENLCRNVYGIHKPVYIEHVHQLQNLYFALTGNELILTPTIEVAE